MPLELNQPIEKRAIKIRLTKLEINFDNRVAYLYYNLVYEDRTEQGKPSIIFKDWTEIDDGGETINHSEFTEFYANYSTHQYLYDKIMEEENLQGTFNPVGEPE